MKKVLLAFDGQHFSEGVLEFVKQMNKHQPVFATGIFLPSVDYAELLYSFSGVMAGPLYFNEAVPSDDATLKKNIANFKTFCTQNNIEYTVHHDKTKHVVTQLKEESRFADLLVLSSRSFYDNLGEETQDDYLTNILHKSECPVVLVPGNYTEPKSVILTYDGSEQSVYAIKQFSYLFPEFHELEASVIYFSNSEDIPGRTNIEELVSHHFSHATITRLKINARKDIERWIHNNGNIMLVAGAYSRSLFFETFRKSFIAEAIHDHRVPVFVAHN